MTRRTRCRAIVFFVVCIQVVLGKASFLRWCNFPSCSVLVHGFTILAARQLISHRWKELKNALHPSRVVLVLTLNVVPVPVFALVPLIQGLRGGTRTLKFCARIFEFYMSDFFNPVNVSIIQRLF